MTVVFGFPDRSRADAALGELEARLPEVGDPMIVEKTSHPPDTVLRVRRMPQAVAYGAIAGFLVALASILFWALGANGPLKLGIAVAGGCLGALIGLFIGAMVRLDQEQQSTEQLTSKLPSSTLVTLEVDESKADEVRRIVAKQQAIELPTN